jgi:hypothetical protein
MTSGATADGETAAANWPSGETARGETAATKCHRPCIKCQCTNKCKAKDRGRLWSPPNQLHLFPCLCVTLHLFLGLWQNFYKGALLRLKAFSALGLF